MLGLAGARRQDIPVWFVILLFVTIIVLPALMSASTVHAQDSPPPPTIWTDKEDYSPVDTVIISGSGFNSNAIVWINVTRPPDSNNVIRTDGYEVRSDGSGSFTYNYALDGIFGTYTVEATDGTNTKTTTFTDGIGVSATWTATPDCSKITATATGLDSGKSYYVTYTDPGNIVRWTSSTHSGVTGFTDDFVLDIAGGVGTWAVKLYESGTPAKLKDTANMNVNKMVWTTDSAYAAMKTSFAQGETVYFKALGLDTRNKYYNFQLKSASGTLFYVGSWTKQPGQLTGSYALPINAPTGTTWQVIVRQADDSYGKSAEDYVARSFTVAYQEYTLTVTVTGSGSVAKSPSKDTYHYNDVVTLTANPVAGWSFSAWSGDISGSVNSRSIIVNGTTSVTATFTLDEYTLTVTTVGSGSVAQVPSEATYNYGDSVQLTANPVAGWSFSAWSGDISGSVNSRSIIVNGTTSVTATFKTQLDYLEDAKKELNDLRAYVRTLRDAGKIGQKEYEHFMKDLDKIEQDIEKATQNLDTARYGYDDKIKGFEDLRHVVMKLEHVIKDVQDWLKKGKIAAVNANQITN